jgi:hypothetical protein
MAVPTIVFDRKPVGVAIVTSLRMVRHYLRPTITLIIVVLLISWGTKLLWRMADSGTWLTLVSLVGNAFISTALACAVFIYYRDRSLYPQVRGN